MQIDDFVTRLRTQLSKERQSYLDKLIASPSSDHDRLAGVIQTYDKVRKTLDAEAARYLTEYDEEAA